MARHGWARSIGFAALMSAVAAAGQAGLGYGLGVISWARAAGPDDGAWSSSLAWSTVLVASSVVIGAVVADRTAGRGPDSRVVRVAWRTMLALSATIGAAAGVPLMMLPAAHGPHPVTFASHLVVGFYATAGLLLGLVAALMALTSRAMAANLLVTTAWLWVLAVVVLVNRVVTHQDLGYASPDVWRFTATGPMWRSYYVPGAMLMLGAALLIGGLAAVPAAGRGAGRVGVAASGALGPLVVAVAYQLAAPTAAQAPFEQVSALSVAPLAIVAGLVGSVLVAAVGGPPSGRARRRRAARAAAGLTDTQPTVGADGPDPDTAVAQPAEPAPTATLYGVPTQAGPAADTSGGRAATVSATASVPPSSRATPGAV